jgi:1-acyl-sn-glycerol-3-phosphate acyltransferase
VVSPDAPLWLARHVWAPPLLFFVFSRFERIEGYELDPKRPYVLVMNHQSMLDIPVAFAFIPVDIRFVFKKILYWVPFLGWFVWRTKMVGVDRANPSQAYGSLAKAAARIRRGVTIIAYPEGTRSVDGTIGRFKRGVFVLAQGAGVPVVPIAIEGTGAVLPTNGFRIRPGVVRFVIGQPIETTAYGSSPEEIDRLRAAARDALIALHRTIGGRGGDPIEEESQRAA